jgi:coenzyme PQQ synthesis protein D (PqqD)
MKPTDLVIREADDLLTTSVDGDLIGMSIDRGICYGFNAVATRSWELLSEPQSLDSLCARLVAEFDVDEETCRAQTEAFLEELRREGLIRIHQGS